MRTADLFGTILVDPEFPAGLWGTPNEMRPADQMVFWGKPFIKTVPNPYSPTGTRFDLYCLDGEIEDRPTCWGMFDTLEAAEFRAFAIPPWNLALDSYASNHPFKPFLALAQL